LAYTAADRAGGGTAWLGLAHIGLYDEQGTCLYQASWETLDFDWRRFLRWHLDYLYQQVYRIGLAHLFVREGPAVPWEMGKGVLHLQPGEVRTFEIVARDFAGNTTRLRLTLRGIEDGLPQRPKSGGDRAAFAAPFPGGGLCPAAFGVGQREWPHMPAPRSFT